MKKFILIILIGTLFSSTYAGQPWMRSIKCANKLYDKKYLQEAIPAYIKAIKVSPTDSTYPLQVKLAKCYELTDNFLKAEEVYALLVQNPKVTNDIRFAYARVQQANGKYGSANSNFSLLATPSSQQFKDVNSKVLDNNFENTDFTVQPLSLNTAGSEYGATYYKKGIVFTSDRGSERSPHRSSWNDQPFTDLFLATEDARGNVYQVEKFPGKINSCLNEGTATFNATGDQIIFSRNNTFKKKYRNKLVLTSATFFDGEWSQPQVLAFDLFEFNYSHPCLSADGNTLYFSSDMNGGFGGMDIYMSKKDGTIWGTPVNLGPQINTSGNELFPFVTNSGTLYFSSNGHVGIGGLDIFSAKLTNGKYKVNNMKMPVNSSKDDFGFVMDEVNGTGFLSSNRSGDDDIFKFQAPVVKSLPTDDTKTKFNQLRLVDKYSGKPIVGAKVEIFTQNEKNGKFYFTDTTGLVSYELIEGKETVISSSVTGYGDNIFKGEKFSYPQSYPLELSMEKIPSAGELVYTNDLFYESSVTDINSERLKILQEVVSKIKTTKNSKIIVNGYADENGNENTNYVLSINRAKTIEQYLLDQGIDKSYVQTNFYGGISISKECRKSKKCIEEANRQNRRVEIKVVTY